METHSSSKYTNLGVPQQESRTDEDVTDIVLLSVAGYLLGEGTVVVLDADLG